MKAVRILATVTVVALLAACAHDFVRPGRDDFALGKSTMADVTQLMGEPTSRDETQVNGEAVQVITYSLSQEAPAGVISPQRTMTFTFFNDVLVGDEFQSSFSNDSTLFDGSKVATIVRGKSTRTDVIEALGEPTGELRYPLVKNRNEEGVEYAYSETRNVWIGVRKETQLLVITFNKNGIVTDILYKKNGIRQL